MKGHWFLPQDTDVLATLAQQGEVTVRGLNAFAAWAAAAQAADGEQATREQADRYQAEVRDCEHQADVLRRRLARELRAAFSTPLDAEDLFILSERLDAVLNAAKNVVRESEALGQVPDAELAAMAATAAEGTARLHGALNHLITDPDRATAEADAAIATERSMEKLYRAAMRTLLEPRPADTPADLAFQLAARRELYRRTLEIGERIASVAERVWYAVVKES